MNATEYARVCAAFTDPDPDVAPPSFRSVARTLNHSARTVREIYERGWNGLPSVLELLEERARRTKLKRLQQRERIESALKGIHARLLSRVGTALAEVPVSLEPIRDTKSARTAVLALRELSDLAHDLYDDEREPAPSVSVNVNVGTGDLRYSNKTEAQIATMKTAESAVARHAGLFDPEHEQQTVEVIGRRWLMTNPPREDDGDDVIAQRGVLERMYPTEPTDPIIRAALQSAVIDEEEEDGAD